MGNFTSQDLSVKEEGKGCWKGMRGTGIGAKSEN